MRENGWHKYISIQNLETSLDQSQLRQCKLSNTLKSLGELLKNTTAWLSPQRVKVYNLHWKVGRCTTAALEFLYSKV